MVMVQEQVTTDETPLAEPALHLGFLLPKSSTTRASTSRRLGHARNKQEI
jgi:hypothetical protein